ncbi:MAG: hypothetical protein ABI539_12110 [Acidobacteriota bacterium]
MRIRTLNLKVLFFVSAIGLFSAAQISAQDLRVEDIISRHLNSIGPPEKLAEIKTRLVLGTSQFESKLPSKETTGKALIASENNNLMFITSFNSKEYPFEKIGYFDGKTELPWVTSGTRSPLGTFIADHERMLSEGLFTGSISCTWPLLNLEKQKAKITANGTQKVNGKKAYVLGYFPKGGGSEFSIQLFFDSETFRHIRTEYRHVIAPQQDSFGTLGRQTGVKITLIESFGDFKTVDGITLPYSYKADYETNSNSGVYQYIWNIAVQQYNINQKLAPGFFSFEAK